MSPRARHARCVVAGGGVRVSPGAATLHGGVGRSRLRVRPVRALSSESRLALRSLSSFRTSQTWHVRRDDASQQEHCSVPQHAPA